MITTCLPAAEIAVPSSTASPWQRRFCCGEVLHREVHAVKLAAGHLEIARPPGAAGQQHRVEVAAQVVGGDVHADVDAGAEHDALGRQQLEPPIEDALLHLELGNAVAQQPADAIGLLEHRHAVAGAIELRGGGQAGRARSR